MSITISLHTPLQTTLLHLSSPSCNNDLSMMIASFEQELQQRDSPYQTGVSKGRHIFVAMERRSKDVADFDVYAIEAPRDVYRLRAVIKLARHTYPDVFNDLSRTILKGFPPMVMNCPEETYYPHGFIFTLEPSQSGSSDQHPSTRPANHKGVCTHQGERGFHPMPESLDPNAGEHHIYRNSDLMMPDQHCTQHPQCFKSNHNDMELIPGPAHDADEGRGVSSSACDTGELIIASEEMSSSRRGISNGGVALTHGPLCMEDPPKFGSKFPSIVTREGMQTENPTKGNNFPPTGTEVMNDIAGPLDDTETIPALGNSPSFSAHASNFMAIVIPKKQDSDGKDEPLSNPKRCKLPSSEWKSQKEEEIECLELTEDGHGVGGPVSLWEAQLLEHACNRTCTDEYICELEHPDLSSCEDVDQMTNVGHQLESEWGHLAIDLKQPIRRHCSGCQCPGAGCKVTHLAAGCGQHTPSNSPSSGGHAPSYYTSSGQHTPSNSPSSGGHVPTNYTSSERYTPSNSPSSGSRIPSNSLPLSLKGLLDISVDSQPANCSITPKNEGLWKVENAPNVALQHSTEEESIGVAKQVCHMMSQQEVGLSGKTGSDQYVPSVQVNVFPDISMYKDFPPGTRCIYTTEKSLHLGHQYPRPDVGINPPLGKGGFGVVYACTINNCHYAVKKTRFRRGELNVSHKFKHPNLTELLAVTIDPRENFCYQYMHRMTGNLTALLRKHECLNVMFQNTNTSPVERRNIVYNVRYISECVLQALDYLHRNNMQHCDVKGTNVLIGLVQKCTCSDFLQCTCPRHSKYQVQLSDFDGILLTKQHRKSSKLPRVPERVKKGTVFGTPGCRAPEQFRVPLEQQDCFMRTIINGRHRHVVDFGGPWCDIWSAGVMVLRVCMGKIDFSKHNVTAEILNSLKSLTEAAEKVGSLSVLAALCKKCLTVEFRDRPTAHQLLDSMKEALADEIL